MSYSQHRPLSDRLQKIRDAAARARLRRAHAETTPAPIPHAQTENEDEHASHEEADPSLVVLSERWRHTLDRDHES